MCRPVGDAHVAGIDAGDLGGLGPGHLQRAGCAGGAVVTVELPADRVVAGVGLSQGEGLVARRWVRVTLPPLRRVKPVSVSAAPSPAVVYALPWRIWVVSSVAVKEKFFVVSPISPTTFLVIVTDR